MILDAIKTNTVFKVNVENLSLTRVTKGIGFLRYDTNYSIFIDKKLYNINIVDKHQLDKIDYFLRVRNNTAIVNVIEAVRDKYFTMEIIFLTYSIKNTFELFYISLNDKIAQTAKKRGLVKNIKSTVELGKKLKEKILFRINGESYFFISTANASVNDIFTFDEIVYKIENLKKRKKKLEKSKELSEEEKNEKITKLEEDIQKLSSKESLDKFEKDKKDLAFTVHGENINLPVKKNIDESGNYKFNGLKLVSFKDAIKKDSLQLVKGEIEFKNGLMSARIANELGDIIESDDSYLKSWDKYLKEEGNRLISRAKMIGEMNLINSEPIGDGYELRFESLHETLSTDDWISFVDDTASYLQNDINFIEYLASKEQLSKLQKNQKKSKIKSFKIEKIRGNFITIKTDENLDKYTDKKVILSIYGDEAQLSRKYQARQRLLEHNSANPILGLIIDGKDKAKEFLSKSSSKRVEPLTNSVREKIFPTNAPTLNQEEAIDIALNTPDIAIVQGPPGTGKTTVLRMANSIYGHPKELLGKFNDIKEAKEVTASIISDYINVDYLEYIESHGANVVYKYPIRFDFINIYGTSSVTEYILITDVQTVDLVGLFGKYQMIDKINTEDTYVVVFIVELKYPIDGANKTVKLYLSEYADSPDIIQTTNASYIAIEIPYNKGSLPITSKIELYVEYDPDVILDTLTFDVNY